MSRSLRSFVLLGATLVLGGLAGTSDVVLASSVPWPIGLVTGCVLWQRRRFGSAAVLGIALLGMVVGYLLTGWSWEQGVGASLAHVAGTATVVAVLTSAGRRRASLLTEPDIGRYVGACAAGAVVGGLLVGGWCVVLQQRFGLAEMVAMVLTHLASQLVVAPLFLRRHAHAPLASTGEQVAAWVVTSVATLAIFAAPQPPLASFAVVAVMSWGARRLGSWGGLVQLVGVSVAAVSLTFEGLGPFVDAPDRLGWTPDGTVLAVQFFVFCCAVVSVPTLLTVGLEQVSLREASRERARIERIVSSADRVAIIGADGYGRMTLFNPGAERLLGYHAGEVLGRSGSMFHDREEITRQTADLGVADDYDSLALALARPDMAGREIRYVRKDGVVRTFLVNLSQVRDLEGEVTGFVCISEDVTDRVQEQQALEEAVARLQELDASKDTFVSSVSHELRTPLTSIVGYLEMLQDSEYGSLTRAQQVALERVADNSARLSALIEDLLAFTRLAQDELQMERVDLDVADVVRTACELLEPMRAQRRTELVVTTPPSRVALEGDAALLERMVVNLVGNAIKFSDLGARVDVTVRSDAGEVELVVADHGMGIPLDEQPRLFTRFFRSRLAMRDAVQGTGIGLSIVKAVVDAHDATIEIESSEGAGTTVRVRLPAM